MATGFSIVNCRLKLHQQKETTSLLVFERGADRIGFGSDTNGPVMLQGIRGSETNKIVGKSMLTNIQETSFVE
jgi:hypothetical protein